MKNRGFATLGYPGRGWGMVKLTPEQQDWLVRASPSTFSPVNGASGPRSSRVGAGLCRAAPNLSGGTGCRRQAGRFAPSVQPPPQDLAASQNAILSRLGATARAVQAAVQRWPEPSLDRYQLLHPLLGRLTVREMLEFSVYHHAHHLRWWPSGPRMRAHGGD